MAKKRIPRPVSKTTLLIVGEGAHDQAFIKHMHRILRQPNSQIHPTIEKQSGGSPGVIIENAIRKYQHIGYDHRIIVLDGDIAISQQDRDKARKRGYTIILWEPLCLEGALLDVLGESVGPHETSQALKARLHPQLTGLPAEPKAYADLFSGQLLIGTKNLSVARIRVALTQKNKISPPQARPV